MSNEKILAKLARDIRLLVLEMIFKAGASHIGCTLSCTDIIVALYFDDILRVEQNNPEWEDRDKFILSKGHGCSALYAALATKGFFPMQILENYGKDGSITPCHNTSHVLLPGIETSNGSLGHGLSMGIGMALDAKNNNRPSRIFILAGDGECQEGSIWEGAMFAGFHKINNLIFIIDKNNLQTLGDTGKILSIEPINERFESFGWEARRVDGHNFSQLKEALSAKAHGKPLVVIAETTKGKGVSFMENEKRWHGDCPNPEEYKQAKKELEESL